MPLVILLHGYTANSFWQNFYFGLNVETQKRGIMLVTPDGTKNPDGSQFWNATDSCCDYYQSGVDDVAYIAGLIEEAKLHFNIDADRVYLVGHSNGGYMSYRMACEHSEIIAGFVSLAGANWYDDTKCGNPGPVAVLQVHGAWDAVILYDGKEPQEGNLVATWSPVEACLGANCAGSFSACMANGDCSSLYACYGTCATTPNFNACINTCWTEATETAQFIWWDTYICGLSSGCYDDPKQSWPGYASAEESVRRWAVRNGCDESTTNGAVMDLVNELPGDDTYPLIHDDCPEGLSAEVWKIEYGSHVPGLNDNWSPALVDWLMNQKKGVSAR
jgi:poly(3-hydroxybutyrate) depolymerase